MRHLPLAAHCPDSQFDAQHMPPLHRPETHAVEAAHVLPSDARHAPFASQCPEVHFVAQQTLLSHSFEAHVEEPGHELPVAARQTPSVSHVPDAHVLTVQQWPLPQSPEDWSAMVHVEGDAVVTHVAPGLGMQAPFPLHCPEAHVLAVQQFPLAQSPETHVEGDEVVEHAPVAERHAPVAENLPEAHVAALQIPFEGEEQRLLAQVAAPVHGSPT